MQRSFFGGYYAPRSHSGVGVASMRFISAGIVLGSLVFASFAPSIAWGAEGKGGGSPSSSSSSSGGGGGSAGATGQTASGGQSEATNEENDESPDARTNPDIVKPFARAYKAWEVGVTFTTHMLLDQNDPEGGDPTPGSPSGGAGADKVVNGLRGLHPLRHHEARSRERACVPVRVLPRGPGRVGSSLRRHGVHVHAQHLAPEEVQPRHWSPLDGTDVVRELPRRDGDDAALERRSGSPLRSREPLGPHVRPVRYSDGVLVRGRRGWCPRRRCSTSARSAMPSFTCRFTSRSRSALACSPRGPGTTALRGSRRQSRMVRSRTSRSSRPTAVRRTRAT